MDLSHPSDIGINVSGRFTISLGPSSAPTSHYDSIHTRISEIFHAKIENQSNFQVKYI